jgi:hypothetical protein
LSPVVEDNDAAAGRIDGHSGDFFGMHSCPFDRLAHGLA